MKLVAIGSVAVGACIVGIVMLGAGQLLEAPSENRASEWGPDPFSPRLATESRAKAVLTFTRGGNRTTTPPDGLMEPVAVIVDGYDSTVSGFVSLARMAYDFGDQGPHVLVRDPDPTGVRIAAFGPTKSLSSDQQGMVAVNLYRSAQKGTEVTLRLRDEDGTERTASATIDIQPDSRVQRYVEEGGKDTPEGGDIDHPWATLNYAMDRVNASGAPTYIRCNRGDEFEATTILVRVPNCRVGAYGTGDPPIVTYVGEAGRDLFKAGASDFGVLDLDVRIESPECLYTNNGQDPDRDGPLEPRPKNSGAAFNFQNANDCFVFNCTYEGQSGPDSGGQIGGVEQCFGYVGQYRRAIGASFINVVPREEHEGASTRQGWNGAQFTNVVLVGCVKGESAYEHQLRNFAQKNAPPTATGFAMTWCDFRSDFEFPLGAGTKPIRLQRGELSSVFQCAISNLQLSYDGAHLYDTLVDSNFFDMQRGNQNSFCGYGRMTMRTTIRNNIVVKYGDDTKLMTTGTNVASPPSLSEGNEHTDGANLFNTMVQREGRKYAAYAWSNYFWAGQHRKDDPLPFPTVMKRYRWRGNWVVLPRNFDSNRLYRFPASETGILEWRYNLYPRDSRYSAFSTEGADELVYEDLSDFEENVNRGAGRAGNNTQENHDPGKVIENGYRPARGTDALKAAEATAGVHHDYRGVERNPRAATWSVGAIGTEDA